MTNTSKENTGTLGITTITVMPEVRDRLKVYRDDNECKNLSVALNALLDEAGVEEGDDDE